MVKIGNILSTLDATMEITLRQLKGVTCMDHKTKELPFKTEVCKNFLSQWMMNLWIFISWMMSRLDHMRYSNAR